MSKYTCYEPFVEEYEWDEKSLKVSKHPEDVDCPHCRMIMRDRGIMVWRLVPNPEVFKYVIKTEINEGDN